ncbi:hypothetical protein MPPM_4781 [Methylorubrum populi]|uniref:Bacteriophage protein n=1 Tax=Methylorubrum populi TaxID=223967 RepID=A0A160PJZ9_9HYPH|nr:hypothetical protein [Methylorubrum populi]BAU93386.1 hypothetical protein MPPM_4781 [Methylorubrum populi]
MNEFEVDGHTYRSKKMNARTQFHVMRRMAPILAPLQSVATGDLNGTLVPLAQAIGSLSDDASDYILDRCLEVVERKQGEAGWAKVKLDGGRNMFDDIDLMALLQIAANVLRDNYAVLFQKGLALQSNGGASL